MNNTQNSKRYDLEERTLSFAKRVSGFVKVLHKDISNVEYSKQLVRSSGSVGANYIEANEALGKKDFIMRIKICRKEAKESRYWLNLLSCDNNDEKEKVVLVQVGDRTYENFWCYSRKIQMNFFGNYYFRFRICLEFRY